MARSVVIVDDDPAFRELAQRVLADTGLTVVGEADSAAAAMSVARAMEPDAVLVATGKPTAGSGVNASKLETTPRSDGKPQVTYNGHPLYTFAMDQSAGDVNGEGLNAFGGLWYVVSPAGNQIVSQPSSSPSSGGGGFSY
jgi:DNA-binding NarL/FixJ family response regulator